MKSDIFLDFSLAEIDLNIHILLILEININVIL